MKISKTTIAASLIAAAGAVPVALALSATAAADPAPAPQMPGVPNLPFIEQLAAVPANAPQLLQSFASALAGVPAAPATPPPAASAAITLPAPAAATPAAAPASAPQSLLPSADVKIPDVPFSPVPLPQQLSFPGSLLPFGAPSPTVPVKPATAVPAPAVAPASAIPPLLFPTSALP